MDKQREEKLPIGQEEVDAALATLAEYKKGKTNLERRVVEDERWYQLRHWEAIREESRSAIGRPEPSSAWLFNSIMNKHADAMDNYQQPDGPERHHHRRSESRDEGLLRGLPDRPVSARDGP